MSKTKTPLLRVSFEIAVTLPHRQVVVIGGTIPDATYVVGDVPELPHGREVQKALEMALDQMRAINLIHAQRSG